ncbi:calcium-binding protein [Stappia sp.]|uniref:calcium-binding protein n=1 Tax=Stappia sp. TaxID=1870903 RepID=UPI0032D8B6C7
MTVLTTICLLGALGPGAPVTPLADSQAMAVQARRGLTCRQMPDCRSAVILWCSGYGRADGDGDGIPCENVCSTRRQVEAILRDIGCNR